MSDGFLGYHASFMLDFVVSALVLIVPVLIFSIATVRYRRRYTLHRNLQLTLGIVLLVAVAAFEIDMRRQGGWRNIVDKPPRAPVTEQRLDEIRGVLLVHLVFAVSTPVLWGVTIGLALRRMPSPPAPCGHSRLHKALGWLSVIDLLLTAATGLAFYYAAFIQDVP